MQRIAEASETFGTIRIPNDADYQLLELWEQSEVQTAEVSMNDAGSLTTFGRS